MALQGTMKLGPWGGTGGSDWSYNPGSGSALKEIVINHGRVVDSISFKSIDATGQTQFSDKFGGDGGTTDQITFDRPGEYLTLISGTINDWGGHEVIESLSFHTNRNKYGPYGSMDGSSFKIPMEGGEIVGFHGRGGYYVDAIGIYAKPSTN
ncbi:hypothetical protein ACOSP7_018662 [Xanthoceras sorbifolium]